MSELRLPPHLTERGGVKICSECKKVFPIESVPTLSQAFRTHVLTAHLPPIFKTKPIAEN
jgi:hypothetical protein